MKIFYTREFVKMLEELPIRTKRLFLKQEYILHENWRDPRLHLKQLRGRPVIFAFRVTRSYRAFFYFRNSAEIVLYAIDHRKDAYRKHLRRK